MGQAVGDYLPLALAIAISPVPVTAVLVTLFSDRAPTNGPAFVIGWAVGLLTLVVVALLVEGPADLGTETDPSTEASWAKIAVGLALVAYAAAEWARAAFAERKSGPPGWQSRLNSLRPLRALGLGTVLATASPKNVLMVVAAAAAIRQATLGSVATAGAVAVFVAIASLAVVAPVMLYLVGGAEAQGRLERWEHWLEANSTTVTVVLLFVVGAVLVGKGLSGLSA